MWHVFSGLISVFVSDILQIPSGGIQICSGALATGMGGSANKMELCSQHCWSLDTAQNTFIHCQWHEAAHICSRERTDIDIRQQEIQAFGNDSGAFPVLSVDFQSGIAYEDFQGYRRRYSD